MENKVRYKLEKDYILEVIQDIDAESPDVWENEDIFLVYDHRSFTVKREGFEPFELHVHNLDDGRQKEIFNDYYIFTVYAYIHGGVVLSLDNSRYPFNDRWDVSDTGFVLVRKTNDLLQGKEFVTEDMARERAEGLIETWNQYLAGDVYGFRLLKPFITYTVTDEFLKKNSYHLDNDDIIDIHHLKLEADRSTEYEEIDSCWGFYGSDPIDNGMENHIAHKLLRDESGRLIECD